MSTSIQITELTPATNVGGLFAQTGNSIPITDSSPYGNLLDGGVGTLTIPANTFQVGDSFSLIMGGHITCTNTSELRIEVLSGSATLADTGVINMPSCTNQNWRIDIIFTIRALGGAGVASIVSNGTFTYIKDSSSAFEGIDFSEINNTTFVTNTSNTLDIKGTWVTVSGGESIFTEMAVLNKIY